MMMLTHVLLEGAYRSAMTCTPASSGRDQMIAAAGAVILSQSAVESHLNEHLEGTRTRTDLPWNGLADVLLRAPLQHRFELYVDLTTGKRIDTAGEPFQSFAALVKLRNAIAHHAPRMGPMGDFPGNIRERLATRFQLSIDHENTPWQAASLNHACARWACETVVALLREHGRLAGASYFEPRTLSRADGTTFVVPPFYPDVPWR